VTLFAHPGSHSAGRLVPYGVPPHTGARARAGELLQLGRTLWRMRRQFDLVHSFGRLASLLPILLMRSLPKLQSYQRASVPWRSVAIASRLAGSSILFTGCSTSVYRDDGPQPVAGRWRTIHNGVEMRKYDFAPRVSGDAPLVFLGRVERNKGAHNAIAIARGSGRRLVIAGNRADSGDEARYFQELIAPELRLGIVDYVGEVDDIRKNALLGTAAALVMAIEWDEPFGIVMAESLACGTPVIGFPRGSVPEVVTHGVNGFLCESVDDAVTAVGMLSSIDRATVRDDCEARFSDNVVVDRYEAVYREMLARGLA
jgi:glycosyltransferase involved in cell wall biosynthesis